MRKRIADISRDIALKLISPWYEPGIGVNPVLRADWLALKRNIRRNYLKFAAVIVIGYLVVPTILVWYLQVQPEMQAKGFSSAVKFFTSKDGLLALVYLGSWILFLNYIVITFLNLINPIGGTGKHSIYTDPPVAPGFASKFLYARLLPRLSILPLCVFITWLYTFRIPGWGLDFMVYPVALVVFLLILDVFLAFFHILGVALLIAIFLKRAEVRMFLVLLFILLLAIAPTSSEHFPVINYEILWWFWRPFGSVLAIANMLLTRSVLPHNLHPPLPMIFATMLLQGIFVYSLWKLALLKFFRDFGRFSASGSKH